MASYLWKTTGCTHTFKWFGVILWYALCSMLLLNLESRCLSAFDISPNISTAASILRPSCAQIPTSSLSSATLTLGQTKAKQAVGQNPRYLPFGKMTGPRSSLFQRHFECSLKYQGFDPLPYESHPKELHIWKTSLQNDRPGNSHVDSFFLMQEFRSLPAFGQPAFLPRIVFRPTSRPAADELHLRHTR